MALLSPENEVNYQKFVDAFVEMPIATTIMADFDRLRYNRKFGGDQQCMLLTGDTGCGKSFLIHEYCRRVNLKTALDTLLILSSRIPSKPTLDSTIIELLKDIGHSFATYRKGKSGDQALTESLIKCLKSTEVELIIINEFQELVEFKSGKALSEIATRLKYISEEAAVPIVLVGMPWSVKIAKEPQWASRLLIRRRLSYFTLSKEPEEFIRFIKGLAIRMPFDEPPKLDDKHTILSLFATSKGQIRTLKHFMNEAVKIALEQNFPTLSNQQLAKTYHLMFPDLPNPFHQSIEQIEGQEVSVTSHYDSGADNEFDAVIPTKYTDLLPLSQLLRQTRKTK
ncbi:TniB family NTP-binding protein [Photobacterium sp. ZSDE20]|uniref:TniB family NTP-binding protein n=1 Tax=Photobacterium pectinilyticum TaxID=2906793 RepID=A0ABT1N494_9GAMM|nr:TniB family NTP-binding protein [Photobacterium sp. ZSDE20]MCQ1059570.1 TniB family NTP-binding protein [Photobacterium sp. ZSDE20]MDD1825433.1 TniB family NTP-binding protein [Photobacterium sp. ZSDE20]